VLDNIEEVLITSDVGVKTTIKIIDELEIKIAKEKYLNVSEINKVLEDITISLFSDNTETIQGFDFPKMETPYIILVVGVNGVGKTTTIGKLAHQYKSAGKKVILGAADTFRAAAVTQLNIWAKRADVDIVDKGMNADPASVAYETVQIAKSKEYDVVIIDTAGRLHNKTNLMNELGKIKKVIQKLMPEAPQEILLVLDASTGQNAIEQAKQFTEVTDVNTIALTKLDGTAKGGVVITITDQFKIPIKYIGLGEKIEDLQIFNKIEYVKSLFNN
jgi:fused signal recognition particle receptor